MSTLHMWTPYHLRFGPSKVMAKRKIENLYENSDFLKFRAQVEIDTDFVFPLGCRYLGGPTYIWLSAKSNGRQGVKIAKNCIFIQILVQLWRTLSQAGVELGGPNLGHLYYGYPTTSRPTHNPIRSDTAKLRAVKKCKNAKMCKLGILTPAIITCQQDPVGQYCLHKNWSARRGLSNEYIPDRFLKLLKIHKIWTKPVDQHWTQNSWIFESFKNWSTMCSFDRAHRADKIL